MSFKVKLPRSLVEYTPESEPMCTIQDNMFRGKQIFYNTYTIDLDSPVEDILAAKDFFVDWAAAVAPNDDWLANRREDIDNGDWETLLGACSTLIANSMGDLQDRFHSHRQDPETRKKVDYWIYGIIFTAGPILIWDRVRSYAFTAVGISLVGLVYLLLDVSLPLL